MIYFLKKITRLSYFYLLFNFTLLNCFASDAFTNDYATHKHRLKALYPEMSWFEEGSAIQTRTISGVINLHLFLNSDRESNYRVFTAPQTPETLAKEEEEQLSLSSFNYIQENFANYFNDENKIRVLELSLVLEHIGKTSEAKARALSGEIADSDHHLFLERCLHHKEGANIFPSYGMLDDKSRVLLRHTKLARFNHIMYSEEGATVFAKLNKTLKGKIFNIESLDFKALILTNICHNAAGAAHRTKTGPIGSAIYTENLHQVVIRVIHALITLQDSSQTEEQALYSYLTESRKIMGLEHYEGYDERTSLTLARLGCMMRLFSLQRSQYLRDYYVSLATGGSIDIANIIEQISPLQHQGKTFTWLSPLLAEIYKQQVEKGNDLLSKGLTLVARALQSAVGTREYTGNQSISFVQILDKVNKGYKITGEEVTRINDKGEFEII